MHKQSFFLLAVLLLADCGTKPVPQAPMNDDSKDSPRAELRIGDGPDESPHLSFKITNVYEHQKPSADAPYHIEGGEWTFFDCQASSDPKVVFTVGTASKSSDGNAPSAWGKAVLIVKDREAGARFVELFSKAFSGKLPAPGITLMCRNPLPSTRPFLGTTWTESGRGAFLVRRGAGPQRNGSQSTMGNLAEVFFNYDLEKRQGEFSEKDADYADDLVAIFASALRDGPRPERTPDNDPNLTRIGPTIGKARKLLSRLAAHYSFSPNGRFAVFQDRSTIWGLPIDKPDGRPHEIIRFDHSPWEVRVVDDDLDLIVQEGIPETRGIKSSGDPMRIWWVDGKTKEKKLLQGPEKDLNLAEVPVSPDHRYVALYRWKNNPAGKGGTRFLYILDRESGEVKVCDSQDKDLTLIDWRETESGLRVMAMTNRWQFGKKEPSELYPGRSHHR